jgi:hypothetical protein
MRRADRQRRGGNRPTAEEVPFEDGPAMCRYSDTRVGLAGADAAVAARWSAASRDK